MSEVTLDIIERARAERGAGALPWPFWLAAAAVLIGWFPCDTLTTTVGALRLHFHFFDLASIIARPARIVTGVNRGDALTIPFGVLCLGALAVMIFTGALLYAVTSGDAFTAAPDAGRVAAALTHFGNLLANHASAVVANRISVGFGVWLSVPGAIYLAQGAIRDKWSATAALARPVPA
jgi:hypothetical protein